ncbi:MAG: copper homeostasis protein CutC, partial [Streptococcus sp.]
IELCDNLAVGGTTPSLGVIKEAIKLTEEKSVGLCVIIRPRGGDFVYTDLEVQAMLADIRAAKEIGVTCFVLGALTSDRKLDQRVMQLLLAACGEAEVVFHMAFDELAHTDQLEAIEWLSEQGVARILTRAGSPGDTLEQRFAHYHRLLDAAKGKIQILPGGGVTLDNRQLFLEQLGVCQLHGTRIVF